MSDRLSLRALTPQQHDFVKYYVATGGNGAEAARKAGYSEQSARQIASTLLDKPHVAEAVRREQRRALARIANKAIVTLEGFLDDKAAPAGARIDAAKTVLDRVGITGKVAEAEEALSGKRLSEMSIEELEQYIAKHEHSGQSQPDRPN